MYLSVHRHILATFSNSTGIKSSNSLKFRRSETFCFLGDTSPRDLEPQEVQPGEQAAINFDKSSPSIFLGKYSVEKSVLLVPDWGGRWEDISVLFMFPFGHHTGTFMWFYQWFTITFDSGGMVKSITGITFISIFYMCIPSHTIFSFESPCREFKGTKNTFVFLSCLLQVALSFTGHCRSHTLVRHRAFANTAQQEQSYGVTPKVWSCRRWLEKDQNGKGPSPGLTLSFWQLVI